jgi:glycosyltransferase involved in cell wall biosynthesis
MARPEINPGDIEVLFLARLHPRKRPTIFVEAAIRLARIRPDVIFALVGPDEGEGPAITGQLRENGAAPRIKREGALDPGQTLERLRTSTIYVLPAVNEPFPMSVLEAMSVGKPVIVTDSCGLAGFIEETNSGLVVDDTVESLEKAIAMLLDDETLRNSMGVNALSAVRSRYGMDNIADRLIGFYEVARVG